MYVTYTLGVWNCTSKHSMSVLIQSAKGSTCWEKVQLSEDVIDLHHQKTNTHTIHAWIFQRNPFQTYFFANRPNTTTSKNWNNAPTVLMKMWSETIPKCPSKGKKTKDFHLFVSMLPVELWLPNSSSVSPFQVATKEQSSKWFGACCLQHLYRNDLPFGLWIWR